MSTDTIDRADLEAWALTEAPPTGAVTLRVEAPVGASALAKGDDPDLIRGIAVLKPGTFNGSVVVSELDLHAYVERFNALRGIFRPPMRLDHSWSISEVIGRFVELRVEDRVDESAGGAEVPMLVGDFRLVGTREEKARLREWIADGKLDERSSELWPYRTNAGAEYPSIFAGCAFVDIPAVEGLGAITLRRATLSATDREDDTVPTDEQPTPDPAEEPTSDNATTEPGAAEDEERPGGAVPSSDPEVDEEPTGDDDGDDDEEEPDEDPQPRPVDAPVGEAPPGVTELRAAFLRGEVDEGTLLAAIDAEADRRADLRVQTETRLAKHLERGVIPLGAKAHAEALLRHSDQAVRDAAHALLEAATPPVKLRDEVGHLGGGKSAQASAGGMTPDELREQSAGREFGTAWAALTAEQRTQPEYLAAYREVMGTDYAPRR